MLKNLEMTLEDCMSESSYSDGSKEGREELPSPTPKATKKKKVTSKAEPSAKTERSRLPSTIVTDDEEDQGNMSKMEVEMFNEEKMGKLLKKAKAKKKKVKKKKSPKADASADDMKSGGTIMQDRSTSTQITSKTTQDSSNVTQDSSNGSDMQLSLSDIQKYIMDNLSKDVKEKIPEGAWSKIFNAVEDEKEEDGSAPSAKSAKAAFIQVVNNTPHCPPPQVDEMDYEVHTTSDGVTIAIEMEDTSVVSEITTHTVAVQREDQRRKEFQQSLENSFAPKEKTLRSPKKKSASPRSSTSKKRVAGWAAPAPLRPLESVVEFPPPDFRDVSRLSVRFGTVSVRNFKRILDINPSVTSGPAIGIGWIYHNSKPVSIDEWESERTASPYTARTQAHLIVPRHERESMLAQLGYTQQDIAKAVRDIRKAKDMRRTTIDNLRVQHIEEKMENAAKMMKNLLRIGKQKGLVRS